MEGCSNVRAEVNLLSTAPGKRTLCSINKCFHSGMSGPTSLLLAFGIRRRTILKCVKRRRIVLRMKSGRAPSEHHIVGPSLFISSKIMTFEIHGQHPESQ